MPASSSTRANRVARWLIVWYVSFGVAFLWQKAAGVYESELGAHPDEAAHYVTGRFVSEALAALPKCLTERSLAPLAPYRGKEAAGGFYEHYPKVALGVWPPAFYLVQSAWTLPFGVSRTSILVLMAALAATTATLLYRAVWKEFGEWAAVAAALLWLSGPLVRDSYGMVMAEMLSALTMFAATLAWGRYLDEHRTRDAVAFGLLAAAAILTKGTGMALVLMCAFSLLATRRWNVLGARATWIGAGLVAVLAGPWTWIFRGEGTRVGGWADNSGGLSFDFTKRAVLFYGEEITLALTVAVAAFALVGLMLRAFPRGERQGRWAALGGLVLGVLLFQCVIPVGLEGRHLVSATPALAMLAIGGVRGLAGLRALRVEGAEQRRREHLWVLLLVLLVAPVIAWPLYAHGMGKKGYSGFQPVAEELLSNMPAGTRVLVSSDASGEGMFISEVAMREQHPNLFIERASASLVDPATKKWDGRNLHSRFLDDESLLAYLTSGKLDYIVLDDAVPEPKRADYHDQLRRVIRENIGIFWPTMESPTSRENEPLLPPVKLYRIVRGR